MGPSFVRKRSSGSVTVFWLERERLLEALRTAARGIGSQDPNVLKIVLFGSLAEGRATPKSDADILVVLKRSQKPFTERIPEWLEKFDIGFPVDVFPYTVDELDTPLAKSALKRGTVLFERTFQGPN